MRETTGAAAGHCVSGRKMPCKPLARLPIATAPAQSPGSPGQQREVDETFDEFVARQGAITRLAGSTAREHPTARGQSFVRSRRNHPARRVNSERRYSGCLGRHRRRGRNHPARRVNSESRLTRRNSATTSIGKAQSPGSPGQQREYWPQSHRLEVTGTAQSPGSPGQQRESTFHGAPLRGTTGAITRLAGSTARDDRQPAIEPLRNRQAGRNHPARRVNSESA